MTKFSRQRALWLVAATIAGCSSERKLSHVESRAPSAAVPREGAPSPVRARITQQKTFAPSCPAEMSELLPQLSAERVQYPPCSPALLQAFEGVRTSLKSEEKLAVEELVNAQCRLNPREGVPEPLDALMRDYDGTHRSRRAHGDPAELEEEARFREELRGTLLAMRNEAAPYDQWVRNNGEFVIPEEQLEFFDRLVNADACRMPDQEVDLSYRTLRNLEDLVHVQPEKSAQRGRLERFLEGVHKVIDRKIKEYFRR